MARLNVSFNEEDKRRLDRLRQLLRDLHGFAPENYADLVRAALDYFSTAKEREWNERHPEALRFSKPSKKPEERPASRGKA